VYFLGMKCRGIALACLLSACGSKPAPVADRAHASVITDASQLIGGPKAAGQLGDFLIANTRVRFIIAAAGPSRAWFPTGGVLLDADRVRLDGEPGDDRLQEMVTRLGLMGILWADQVEIAHDGADGSAAVVRVTGHDIPVPILQSVVAMPLAHVTAVTEYRLDPYAESLQVVTTLTDASGQKQQVQCGDAFVMGDFVTLFAPGYGSDQSQIASASGLRYFAGFGGAVSYGYLAPGHKLAALFPQTEVFALGTERVDLAAHGSGSFTRDFAVGTGDVVSLLPEIVRREGGDPSKLVPVSGQVHEDTTGVGIVGAQVQISSGGTPYAVAVVGIQSSYSGSLERGTYQAVATAPARTGTPRTIDLSTPPPDTAHIVPADLTLSATGSVMFDVRDDANVPTPARIALSTAAGAGAGQFLSPDGHGQMLLAPGDYRAVISRGFEWEAATVPFSITAGAITPLPATITRVVDTSGWVAIDSHTHTAISVDSELDPKERVAQALADGVEVVIATDHDVLFDLQPSMDALSATGGFVPVIGCEVSPVPGHINGYPVNMGPMTDTAGYWEVKWWSESPTHQFQMDLWPSDLFTALRTRLSAQVVQLNHPRSGQGVLNWVGYDPLHGLAAMDPAQLDDNWDVIEICNSGCDVSAGSTDDQALHDWYSFLNQGLKKGAVGVSDAHVSTNMLGRARTLVEVHDDDPHTLDSGEVWTSLKAGRAVVVDGPFVTLTVTDDAAAAVGPGGLAKATGAMVTAHVKVQAPSWISTDHLRLVANGAELQNLAIPTSTSVVRFDADVPLAGMAADAWLVAVVDGDTAMAPVLGDKPRAITNPVYLDRNGNGSFEAPGL
jgi:hypothetical protein